MQTAYYKLRAVPPGEGNQGETGEKAGKKGGNAVYFVPVLLLKIEGKADRTAKVYKFICQYFD